MWLGECCMPSVLLWGHLPIACADHPRTATFCPRRRTLGMRLSPRTMWLDQWGLDAMMIDSTLVILQQRRISNWDLFFPCDSTSLQETACEELFQLLEVVHGLHLWPKKNGRKSHSVVHLDLRIQLHYYYLHRKCTKANKSFRILFYSFGKVIIQYPAQIQSVFCFGLTKCNQHKRAFKHGASKQGK